jgi:hypothetical protein
MDLVQNVVLLHEVRPMAYPGFPRANRNARELLADSIDAHFAKDQKSLR